MPNIYWTRNATAAIGPSGQTDFNDAREAADNEDRANIRDMAKILQPEIVEDKSIDLDIEAIKKLIEKRKKEKKKLAMGGIAGVL